MVHEVRKSALKIHSSQRAASVYTSFQDRVSRSRGVIAEIVVIFVIVPVDGPKGLIRNDSPHVYRLFPTSAYYVLRDRTS